MGTGGVVVDSIRGEFSVSITEIRRIIIIITNRVQVREGKNSGRY